MISLLEVSEAIVSVDKRLTPGPIELLSQWHWERIDRWAVQATSEELTVAVRRRGAENLVNTLVISGLGLTAMIGGLDVGTREAALPTVSLALMAGPIALGICLLGPIRGIVRMSEGEIFRKELQRRGFTSSLEPLPAPE